MAKAMRIAAALRPGFDDRLRDARYQVASDRFLAVFDSGKEFSFPRSVLECDDGSQIVSVRVERRRFFFQITQASGNRYEVPWDRILYESESAYSYRAGAGKTITPRGIGAQIAKRRKAKRMTQTELARAAHILRPNLSRIEAGKHRPTLETLEKLAAALRMPVAELITDR
jgi:DNA-binding XRE family transcriptional regulator